ncbi:hypothetical protein CAPTEDRAFT_46792, partial [Capitella teleta]
INNTIQNLEERGIRSGFDFLSTTAGFPVNQTLIFYQETSSYGRAILVGMINTIVVAIVGILLTTALGFIIGIARLSKNPIIKTVAYSYVEAIRNIPLLLQIYFWYSVLLQVSPEAVEYLSFGFDHFYLNIRGLFLPKPIFSEGSFLILFGAFVLAIVFSYFLSRWSRRRQMETGQLFPVFWVSVVLIIGLPLLVFFALGAPLTFEHPVFVGDGPTFKRGFQLNTGFRILPEFMALTIALVIYTAAFIAEIVRAGIESVSHGQTEAAYSLGLRPRRALRLVIIPQALRVIIPPLTSQYLNLTKNSSLAVAIAYPDLVSTGGTVLNQNGQAIENIAIWMAFYLSL